MPEPLLQLQGLGKTIGTRRILRELAADFSGGRRYLLTGPNGSGKTTLLKIIAALMTPTAGRILWQGRALTRSDLAYRRQVSFLSHRLYMYEELTGRENLEFFAGLYDVADPARRAEELLEQVGLRHFMNERVRDYSQGMKQRLGVARAVAHQPTILLFDEPFTGLDLRGIDLLRQLLGDVLAPGTGTLILTTHEPELGWQLAEEYLYLERGELRSRGDRARFASEQIEARLRGEREVGIW